MLAEQAPAERKMFGGVCFMINGNMLAGTFKGDLLVRVGKDGHAAALKRPHTRPMEQAGRVAARRLGATVAARQGIGRRGPAFGRWQLHCFVTKIDGVKKCLRPFYESRTA